MIVVTYKQGSFYLPGMLLALWREALHGLPGTSVVLRVGTEKLLLWQADSCSPGSGWRLLLDLAD